MHDWSEAGWHAPALGTEEGRGHHTRHKRDACAWLQMEVGIEDCLHIEFEYSKGKYHLSDTVVGKIYFLLVRIRLKHMEIEIRRRETTGAPHFVAVLCSISATYLCDCTFGTLQVCGNPP